MFDKLQFVDLIKRLLFYIKNNDKLKFVAP